MKNKEKIYFKNSTTGLPRWLGGKNPPANAGDTGWIPGWGTGIPHAAQQQ